MPTLALGSRRSLGPAVAVSFAAAVATLLAGSPAAAQAPAGGAAPATTLKSTTLPLPDEGTARWYFEGSDLVVGLIEENKGDNLIGHFNAFSLSDPKALWHTDQSLGNKDQMGARVTIRPSAKTNDWYVGKGPVSLMDLSTGAVKWTLPCEKVGFVGLDRAQFLSGNRLLIYGSKKCDAKDDFDALKDPQFTMVNTATGEILWQYQTKSLEYDSALGYWARVAKWRGENVKPDKNRQFFWTMVTPKGAFDNSGIYEPDRVALAGEQWEVIRLSDGVSLVKTKDKPGILRGAYNGTVIFRDGDEMRAYTPAGPNPIWSFDLKKKGGLVYSPDDLIAKGYGVPDGMGDLWISEADVVSRVSIETGKAAWSIKRSGMRVGLSKHAVLTEKDDQIVAYDWKSAAKMWQAKIKGRPKPEDAGDKILFVAGDKNVEGVPQPPLVFTVVNGSGGQILWSRKDIDGKKITGYRLVGDQVLRAWNEKGTIANYKMSDGTPAEAAQAPGLQASASSDDDDDEADADQQKGFFMSYQDKEKALQCRDFTGRLVWERKGESSMGRTYKMGQGCIIWATKDGTVEVINLADGASLWKQNVDTKNHSPMVNRAGTYMVLQNKKEVSIVKLPGA